MILKKKITQEELQQYIEYVKKKNPKITDNARKTMVRAYNQLRSKTQGEHRAFHVTVRQMESMVPKKRKITAYLSRSVEIASIPPLFWKSGGSPLSVF